MPEPSSDLTLLREVALEAGALALRWYKADTAPEQWEKEDASPVSEADLAVDALLRTRLTEARPGYGWLSEETEDDKARLSCARVFVVDPIDGTRAFLKGQPHWAVCAAVVEQGLPVAAVVYNPALDEMFCAEKGCGATLNGAPIRTTAHSEIGGARMLGHEGLYRHKAWPTPWPVDMHIENRNSIAYTLCLIAAGQFDGTVSLTGKSDWDLAAADLILAEAGGHLTTHEGTPMLYNQPGTRHLNVVAAGVPLHAALLKKLTEYSAIRQ